MHCFADCGNWQLVMFECILSKNLFTMWRRRCFEIVLTNQTWSASVGHFGGVIYSSWYSFSRIEYSVLYKGFCHTAGSDLLTFLFEIRNLNNIVVPGRQRIAVVPPVTAVTHSDVAGQESGWHRSGISIQSCNKNEKIHFKRQLIEVWLGCIPKII